MAEHEIIINSNTALVVPSSEYKNINTFVDATLKTIAGSSQRVYNQTYQLWINWCIAQDIDPLDMRLAG